MRSVFSLDRHAVVHRNSVFVQELPSESRKVAMVGSAFEVAHKFLLERAQIQGNSGEVSCPANKVPNWQPRILLCMVEARLTNMNKHTHTHTHTPWEDQCEWHRMTRMTGPDCVVMCNFINTHTHTPD